MKHLGEFTTRYLNEPFIDEEGERLYKAAEEYHRRVDEYEVTWPGEQYRVKVSFFARMMRRELAAKYEVEESRLQSSIVKLSREHL